MSDEDLDGYTHNIIVGGECAKVDTRFGPNPIILLPSPLLLHFCLSDHHLSPHHMIVFIIFVVTVANDTRIVSRLIRTQ